MTSYIMFGIASILWVVFFKQSLVVNQIRKSMKVMRQSGKVPFDKDVMMTFTEKNIEYEKDGTQMNVLYSSIEKIVTGENALYLYKSAIEAFIFPYRAFTGEEKEAFLRFLAQKTNAAVIPGLTK